MATATKAKASGSTKLVDLVTTIRTEMKDELVERGTEIDLLVACVLARVHIILLGEPGVAKSMLVDQFFTHIDGANLWKGLFNKNTLPEEVFGPPSLNGLENDEFYFVYGGMLPDAHLGFADEIFKCNSTILNGMLSIANERKWRNGTRGWMDVPLSTLVGGSNELPSHDREDLVAFRDRFGFTKIVQPVRSQDGLMKVLDGQLARNRGEQAATTHTTIALADIEALQAEVAGVQVPNKVQRALADLRMKAENAGLLLSVRRMFEGVKVCQANALLNGRLEVRTEDLRIFEHVLWNDQEDVKTAAELTIDFAGAVGRKTATLRTEYEEANDKFIKAQKNIPVDQPGIPDDILDELTHAASLMTKVNKRVDEAIQDAEDNAWDPTELESLKAEVKRQQKAIRDFTFGNEKNDS